MADEVTGFNGGFTFKQKVAQAANSTFVMVGGLRPDTNTIHYYVDNLLVNTNVAADAGSVPDNEPCSGASSDGGATVQAYLAYTEAMYGFGGAISTTVFTSLQANCTVLNMAIGR